MHTHTAAGCLKTVKGRKKPANFVLISQWSRKPNLLSAEQGMLVKGKEGRLNFL